MSIICHIWPWSRFHRLEEKVVRLRAERDCTEALLTRANEKLKAGGRARGAKHHAAIMARARELGMHVVGGRHL